MTFGSFANDVAVSEEAVSVKVSYGDDLRRANVTVTAYVALRDLLAQLFELDPATVVLKYQDNEGDKITVSSDAEVREALQFAKEKNILRLFVEVKAIPAPIPTPAPAPVPAPAEQPGANLFPFGGCRRFGGPLRGGFPHRGGHPMFYGHGHPQPFPHRGFSHHLGSPVASEHVHYVVNTNSSTNPNQEGPSANFSTPYVFGHGVFSPADQTFPPHVYSPHARHALKEQMHVMKAQIRTMKATAVTEEDFKAIKELKEQMRAECKLKWHEMKSEKKACKKADKKAEKAQWKEWKQEKKCKKGDRKCKDYKRCKDDRLVAKHVADVTIPDNSELPADAPATKTWRLRNAGTLAWPADSQLIFVSRRGDNLNGPERVFVGAVEPQQEVDVSVTFITPAEPGRYIGYYRMATADGAKFGKRVWVSFVVPAGAPANENKDAAPSAPLLYPLVNPASPTTHAPLVTPTTQAPPSTDLMSME